MPSARSYIPLSTDPEEEKVTTVVVTKAQPAHIGYYLVVFAQTLCIIVLALAALGSSAYQDRYIDERQGLVYSPAKEVAFGQAKVFDLSPENASDYNRGPSDEVNELWRSLYKAGISSLTPEEQTNLRLVGVDADEIARRPEKLIQLAVFHDMHCVNKLRQRLFPDYYTDPSLLLGTWHMDHCIDAIRQTIMCSGDITPVVWRWNYATATAMRDASVIHQCRDFDRVQEWAMKRAPEV